MLESLYYSVHETEGPHTCAVGKASRPRDAGVCSSFFCPLGGESRVGSQHVGLVGCRFDFRFRGRSSTGRNIEDSKAARDTDLTDY